MSFTHMANEIGELVDAKNAAYGSSFAKSGEFLRLLYPGGITPEQYDDALLLVRIFDKQMRIATDRDALGESPYRDIAGYGLLGATYHEERKNGCGSANGLSVEQSSKEQPASAAPNTSAKTTTSESATNEPEPSSQPASSSHQRVSAPAETAMEIAKRNAVALALGRNKSGLCGCGCGISRFAECRIISYSESCTMLFASHACLLRFQSEETA